MQDTLATGELYGVKLKKDLSGLMGEPVFISGASQTWEKVNWDRNQMCIRDRLYRIIEEKKHISNAVLGAEDNIQTNIVDMMANLFDTNEEEE